MSDAPSWLTQLAEGSLAEVSEVQGEALKVTSGRIVACDPLVYLSGADPFTRKIPPGRYPVSIGKLDGDNAFAVLRLSAGKIASWQVARCPDEEDVEGWPGFGVDSGVACFVDFDAVQAFVDAEEALGVRVSARMSEEGVDPDDIVAQHEAFERVRAELGADDPLVNVEAGLLNRPTVSAALSKDANLVAFKSGFGDGVYASFWGLDGAGDAVVLVTDFGLLLEDDDGLDDDLDPFGELDELAQIGAELGAQEDHRGGLTGLDALAAALGMGGEPEPETRQGPSPLFLQSKALLEGWVTAEKIELEPEVNMDLFAEEFLELLVSLSGKRHPGSHIADWLVDRPEIADVFASDDDLEQDLTG